MSMEETNAFSALNQLMIPFQQNMVSPTKQPEAIHPEKWMQYLMQLSQQPPQHIPQMPQLSQMQMPSIPQITQVTQIQQIPPVPVVIQTSSAHESQGDQLLKASPSAGSEMSSDSLDASPEQYINMIIGKPLQSIDSQANIAANESKPMHEAWMECFTTTKFAEYEALLFSVYVTERTTQKFDGYTHFDCLHRLQSKCRYRVRSKTQDEFFIVEEKGVHNHGAVEPVGQAGSHAGLPKTIREIVDRAYNDGWTVEMRTAKVDEEIKRLGLPANPRLGRQIDNRIAYLRRVKNLSESRRMQDQVNVGVPLPSTQSPSSPSIDPVLLNPQMLHALMEQNGGSLTVEKDIVEKLLGSQAVAELAAQQGAISPPQPVEAVAPEVVQNEELPMNQGFLEFIQQQKINHDNEQALLAAQHAAMAMIGGHENM